MCVFNFKVMYLQDHGCKMVWETSSLGFLMQLAKYTIHNHCLFSLSATRATTQWLKQPYTFAVSNMDMVSCLGRDTISFIEIHIKSYSRLRCGYNIQYA